EKVITRYYNTLIGRADPRGARFLLAGRRWSEWDIYGHMIESGDWVAMRLPAERPKEKGLFYDVYVPPTTISGEPYACCFTEGGAQEVESDNPKYRKFRAFYGLDPLSQGFYWPASPVKRQEYFSVKKNRPAEAAAVYQGEPGSRESGIFLASDFQLTDLGSFPALLPQLLPESLQTPACRTIQAWDTAHEENPDSDYSVCTTAIMVPCNVWHRGEEEAIYGKAGAHYDVYVVDIFRQKLEFGGLVEAMRRLAMVWGPSFIAVEKTTGTIPLIQSLSTQLPITPINIQMLGSKRNRLTMAIGGGTASVQGWLRQGRVFFWAQAPWFQGLKQEMLNFSGDGSGHDDQVDSLGLAIVQAISLGSGSAILPGAEAMAGDARPPIMAGPRHDALQAFSMLGEMAEAESERRASMASPGILPSPESSVQLCANCKHREKSGGFCRIQKRRTAAIETCESWNWAGGLL
ncbi:MAG TPA: hypothetical protein VNG91_08725, partial [Terriglobia bacterium]|nr:hypothetical protein [Terriglobia bacterium]